MTDRRIPLGVLLKPHGLRGAVRIHLYDPQSTTLRPGLACDLERDGKVQRTLVVAEVRGAAKTMSVQFAGIANLADGESLRGLTVVVLRRDLPELEAGEFYIEDMLGAEVFERSPGGGLEAKGKVTAFERYPSTDVVTVQSGEGDAATSVEVPLLERYVESVDSSAPRIVLHAGALEEMTP